MQLSCRFKAIFVLGYLSDETLNSRLFAILLWKARKIQREYPKKSLEHATHLCVR